MNRVFWLLLGLVALAACSQPPADGGKADVTVSVAFPSTQGQLALDPGSFLRTLGAPPDAYGAKITITPSSGGSPIITTVTRDNPSTTVTLNTGDYSFEASVYPLSDSSLEIAWGETGTVNISTDTTVSIQVNSIVRSAFLLASGAPIQQGDKAQAQLFVSSGSTGSGPYGGLQVPPGDYSVSWSVGNTTDSIAGNVLGAEVTWGGQSNPIVVTATVSGMGENHQPTTLTATANVYPFQGGGNGFTLTGTLPNWNGPSGTQIVPLAGGSDGPPDTPVANPAAVSDATGDFTLTYFDGAAMASAADALMQFENLIDVVCAANETWSDPPEPAVFSMQSEFALLDTNGDTVGTARVVPSDGSWGQLAFWYLDRSVNVIGSCAGSDGFNYTFDLQLQAGWNAVTIVSNDNGTPSDPSDDTIDLTGYAIANDPYSIPSNYQWEYSLYNPQVIDYGLTAPQTSFNPAEGSTVDVTLTVHNYGTVDLDPVTVNLTADAGLSITNISGADSTAADNTSFDLTVPPGNSRDVTLTIGAASGTAGQQLSLTATLNISDDNDTSNNSVTLTFTPTASGQSVNVGIAMDLNPPVIYFDAPAYQETIDPTSSPYFVAIYASDAESGVAEIELYQGYQPIATLSNGDFTQDPNDPARYSYSWDVSNLAPGEYKLTAIAYDSATNASYSIVSVTVQ